MAAGGRLDQGERVFTDQGASKPRVVLEWNIQQLKASEILKTVMMGNMTIRFEERELWLANAGRITVGIKQAVKVNGFSASVGPSPGQEHMVEEPRVQTVRPVISPHLDVACWGPGGCLWQMWPLRVHGLYCSLKLHG